MPSTPFTLQGRVGRFRDQRWLLDKIIELTGPEFDQARLQYYSAPMSPDHRGPVMGLKALIKRWDDLTREFARLARRYELQGRVARGQGHDVTASDDFFSASVMYAAAQWPLFDNTELNRTLEKKKNECYAEYIRGADHVIEAVEVPYGDKTLPAYFHLPQGYTSGQLPCVVMQTGMDATKEIQINASADRFLRRGMAVLMIDGPGSGSSLTREIWNEPTRYGEVGSATFNAMAARPEVDASRIMVWGLSFGSFWATQMAAAEPRFAACAVMYTCFQPRNWPLYDMAAPSFKQRFMYMTGTKDEADFPSVMEQMDVMKLSAKITMPYFVMAGEDDSLSDFGCTIEHLNGVRGPKTLIVFAGEEHGMGGSRSSQLGPPFFPMICDWLADRAAGKPLESTYNVVDTLGIVHTDPWGENRSYAYGAPLGVEQLFSDKPPVGIA
jgi:dienelactone hydrolase